MTDPFVLGSVSRYEFAELEKLRGWTSNVEKFPQASARCGNAGAQLAGCSFAQPLSEVLVGHEVQQLFEGAFELSQCTIIRYFSAFACVQCIELIEGTMIMMASRIHDKNGLGSM